MLNVKHINIHYILLYYSASIFVRCDENRYDILKALIIGD